MPVAPREWNMLPASLRLLNEGWWKCRTGKCRTWKMTDQWIGAASQPTTDCCDVCMNAPRSGIAGFVARVQTPQLTWETTFQFADGERTWFCDCTTENFTVASLYQRCVLYNWPYFVTHVRSQDFTLGPQKLSAEGARIEAPKAPRGWETGRCVPSPTD